MAPRSVLAAGLALLALVPSFGHAIELLVKPTGGNASYENFYGLMHEDINNSGDGGIYAELLRNRAFQHGTKYPASLDAWSPLDGSSLELLRLPDGSRLSNALPYSVRVTPKKDADPKKQPKTIGLANSGYWGMDVRPQKYTGSFWVRGEYTGAFGVELRGAEKTFGRVEVGKKGDKEVVERRGEWRKYEFGLVPQVKAPTSNNTFVVEVETKGLKDGALDFGMFSLFPPTYKGRKNGLRIDLAERLAALNPKWLRYPGGNMLEGNTIPTFWNWTETIGPLEDRPGMDGVWEYPVTNGLGVIEYMEWADDMGLETIVGVWSGLALDGNFLPESEIGWAVQHGLNQIEFLVGDANTTKWGAVRASLGYPKPWKVRYVEIGNEDWLAGRPAGFDSYKNYRLEAFRKAFTEKYPEIQLIASPSVFDDMVIPEGMAGDHHPYLTPDQFVSYFSRFDNLSRNNLTLIGEAASTHPNGGIAWEGDLMPFPWWAGSVAEAIFLIGAERNADKVIGACYAPMLRNMNRWQWSQTLLQYAADPALTTTSTSWYVWKLLGAHVISATLPVSAPAGAPNFNPLYYVAGRSSAGTGIIKAAVYNSTETIPVSIKFEGDAVKEGDKAKLTVLTGPADPYAYNDPHKGNNVVKTKESVIKAGKGGVFELSLPGLSVAALETVKKIYK